MLFRNRWQLGSSSAHPSPRQASPAPCSKVKEEKPRPPRNWLFGAPALLAVAFLLLPFLALLARIRWSEVIALLRQSSSQQAIMLSLSTSALATLICFLLGTPLCLFLAREPFGLVKKLLQSLVTLPMVLPPVVAGLLLLITWGRRGLLGSYLAIWGIEIGFTTVAAVLAQAFVALPFFVTSLLGALRARGQVYEQAAAALGASPRQILSKITLPLSLPALLGALSLAFARALGEFGATLTFAGSLPGVTRTLALEIYLQRENDTDTALALALLLLALALLLLFFSQAITHFNWATWKRILPGKGGKPVYSSRTEDTRGSSTSAPLYGQVGTSAASARLQGQLEVKAVFPERGINAALSIPLAKNTAIIGGNGAGKSTLLELVAGTLTGSQAEITWPEKITPSSIGYLPQNPLLFPHLNLLENVAFPLRCRGLAKQSAQGLAWQQLHQLEVADLAFRYPQQVSGGQAQRVCLARALVTAPQLLLLDEPFTAIDAEQTGQMRTLLSQLSGVTIILVTHDLNDVLSLADEVVLLDEGRVKTQGNIKHFWEHSDSAAPKTTLFLQEFLKQLWVKELAKRFPEVD